MTLFLPAPDTIPRVLLVEEILSHLTDTCGGVTVSSYLPPAFIGWWFDEGKDHIEKEENLPIIADTTVPLQDPDLLLYLENLKLRDYQVNNFT